MFTPSFSEVEAALSTLCADIAACALTVPRVETRIFPGLAQDGLCISSYTQHHQPVLHAQTHVQTVVRSNIPGALKYIAIYEPHAHLFPQANGKSKVCVCVCFEHLFHFI